MDAFVSKFSKDNVCEFAASVTSTNGYIEAMSIAADKAGNVYVVGNFETDASISTDFKIESDYQDIFIAKFDANGQPVWIKGLLNGMAPLVNKVVIDGNDNFILSGAFSGTLNFDLNGGSAELSSDDSEMAFFIAKYDKNGDLIWAKGGEGTGTTQGKEMVTDLDNNIYLSGEFSGSVAFNNGGCAMIAKSTENTDNFIVKYDAQGSFLWGRNIGGTKLDRIADMDIRDGRLAIAGVIRSQDLTIDNNASLVMQANDITPEGTNYNILVISLSTDGIYQWHYVGGGIQQPSEAYAVKVEADGSVWSGGVASGSYEFNPAAEEAEKKFPSKSKGGRDLFLIKLSPKGEVLIGHRVGDVTNEEVWEILLGNNGLMYVVDLVHLRQGTATPVNLYGDPITIAPMGSKLNVALLCYQQIYSSSPALKSIKLNEAFEYKIETENANGDVTFICWYGSLPEGIQLDATTGKLSGTPTQKGISDFTIAMTDAEGNRGFTCFSLNVTDGSSIGTMDHDNLEIGISGNGTLVINTGNEICNIQVYDLMGRKQLDASLTGTGYYNLSNRGIYTVVVKTTTGNVVRKIAL